MRCKIAQPPCRTRNPGGVLADERIRPAHACRGVVFRPHRYRHLQAHRPDRRHTCRDRPVSPRCGWGCSVRSSVRSHHADTSPEVDHGRSRGPLYRGIAVEPPGPRPDEDRHHSQHRRGRQRTTLFAIAGTDQAPPRMTSGITVQAAASSVISAISARLLPSVVPSVEIHTSTVDVGGALLTGMRL